MENISIFFVYLAGLLIRANKTMQETVLCGAEGACKCLLYLQHCEKAGINCFAKADERRILVQVS